MREVIRHSAPSDTGLSGARKTQETEENSAKYSRSHNSHTF